MTCCSDSYYWNVHLLKVRSSQNHTIGENITNEILKINGHSCSMTRQHQLATTSSKLKRQGLNVLVEWESNSPKGERMQTETKRREC